MGIQAYVIWGHVTLRSSCASFLRFMKPNDLIPCLKGNVMVSLTEVDNWRESVTKWDFFLLNFSVHCSCRFFCPSSSGPANDHSHCLRNRLRTEGCCASNITSFLLLNRLKEYPWLGRWLSNQLYIKVQSDFFFFLKYSFLKSSAFSPLGSFKGRDSTREGRAFVKPMH